MFAFMILHSLLLFNIKFCLGNEDKFDGFIIPEPENQYKFNGRKRNDIPLVEPLLLAAQTKSFDINNSIMTSKKGEETNDVFKRFEDTEKSNIKKNNMSRDEEEQEERATDASNNLFMAALSKIDAEVYKETMEKMAMTEDFTMPDLNEDISGVDEVTPSERRSPRRRNWYNILEKLLHDPNFNVKKECILLRTSQKINDMLLSRYHSILNWKRNHMPNTSVERFKEEIESTDRFFKVINLMMPLERNLLSILVRKHYGKQSNSKRNTVPKERSIIERLINNIHRIDQVNASSDQLTRTINEFKTSLRKLESSKESTNKLKKQKKQKREAVDSCNSLSSNNAVNIEKSIGLVTTLAELRQNIRLLEEGFQYELKYRQEVDNIQNLKKNFVRITARNSSSESNFSEISSNDERNNNETRNREHDEKELGFDQRNDTDITGNEKDEVSTMFNSTTHQMSEDLENEKTDQVKNKTTSSDTAPVDDPIVESNNISFSKNASLKDQTFSDHDDLSFNQTMNGDDNIDESNDPSKNDTTLKISSINMTNHEPLINNTGNSNQDIQNTTLDLTGGEGSTDSSNDNSTIEMKEPDNVAINKQNFTERNNQKNGDTKKLEAEKHSSKIVQEAIEAQSKVKDAKFTNENVEESRDKSLNTFEPPPKMDEIKQIVGNLTEREQELDELKMSKEKSNRHHANENVKPKMKEIKQLVENILEREDSLQNLTIDNDEFQSHRSKMNPFAELQTVLKELKEIQQELKSNYFSKNKSRDDGNYGMNNETSTERISVKRNNIGRRYSASSVANKTKKIKPRKIKTETEKTHLMTSVYKQQQSIEKNSKPKTKNRSLEKNPMMIKLQSRDHQIQQSTNLKPGVTKTEDLTSERQWFNNNWKASNIVNSPYLYNKLNTQLFYPSYAWYNRGSWSNPSIPYTNRGFRQRRSLKKINNRRYGPKQSDVNRILYSHILKQLRKSKREASRNNYLNVLDIFKAKKQRLKANNQRAHHTPNQAD